MATYVKQEIGNYRMIRRLFVIGLIGLIVAVSGIIWLVTGYAKLAQRAALYSGTWSLHSSCDICDLTGLEIKSDGLTLTIVAVGDSGNCSGCDIGTGSETFTGEPITVTIPYSAYPGFYLNITLILNNAQGTQLKVTGYEQTNQSNDISTLIFQKSGS